MAAVQFAIELEDVRLEDAIREAVDTVRSKPLMQELASAMRAQTRDRFRDEVGPDGKEWVASQRAVDENGKTLQDTRHLFKSIVTEAEPFAARIGTARVDSAIHQFGGKAGRGGAVELPARPYLGVNRDDAAELEDVVLDHIRRAAA